MLNLDHISYAYPGSGRNVIDNLSANLEPGKVYGLLGRNGAGKTTLLQLMAGLLTPDLGTVCLDGEETRRRRPSTMASLYMVPEGFDVPDCTVEKFAKVNAPFYPTFSADDFMANLDEFGLQPSEPLRKLSTGRRKQAMISFAIACNTPLLLLDEPTNGLDIPAKDSFRNVLARSMTDSRMVIVSTHQVRDLGFMLDHVLILSDRSLLLDASVGTITGRLRFSSGRSVSDVPEALFSRPAAGGFDIVSANLDGEESDIDLELLFMLATSRPDVIRYMFNSTLNAL